MKTLVLGLGNTLLKDDGIAIRIVEALQPALISHHIDVKISSLSGLALIDEILGYDRLIVVDAIQSHTHQVGDVFSIEVSDMQKAPAGASPHYIGLPSVIRYCRLYNLDFPEEIKVLGIEVEDPFTVDDNLCDKLQLEFNTIAEKVKTRILH
jgi:hydrogenase maturation protease